MDLAPTVCFNRVQQCSTTLHHTSATAQYSTYIHRYPYTLLFYAYLKDT